MRLRDRILAASASRLAWGCLVVVVFCLTMGMLYEARTKDRRIAALHEQNAAKEKLLCDAAKLLAATVPKLHHDTGAAYVYVATSYKVHEIEAVHEYVISIFRREDPEHFSHWEAHVIDHSADCGPEFDWDVPCAHALWRFGDYSVVVPNISMPAMASLCRMLQYRYGWFWPHQAAAMPGAVRSATRYPGRTELVCIRSYQHRQALPLWLHDELHWQHWERKMLTAPGDFAEYDEKFLTLEDNWAESPWRHRPQLHRDLLGYAPSNG